MPAKKITMAWTGEANLSPAVSTQTTRRNLTGSWRYMRPFYRSLVPPCSHDCPAGNDVRGFLELALNQQYDEALELILETSPFPSVCGRVCYHPCETRCNRGFFDDPIAIHSVERVIAERDFDITKFKPEKKLGKRVAIIGSGPGGLSCAYHLARKGVDVTVYESMPKAGGMLQYGIPDYRLPKDVLDKEIERITQLGVVIKTNSNVDSEMFKKLQEDYDAVFVGIGAHGEQKMQVPGEELKGISSGLAFLKKVNAGDRAELDGRLVVVGGGNTAMDVVRSAKRLGADPIVVYRRSETEMPAHPDEVKEAKEEGIEFHFLAVPIRYVGHNGQVTAVEVQRMKLGEPDESGRRRPVPVEDDTYIINADMVMTAIGERPEIDFVQETLKIKWNRIFRDEEGKTSLENVFCGGDAGIDAQGTVVDAIGEGRRAAFTIEAYLTGEPSTFVGYSSKLVDFESMNTDYFKPHPRQRSPHLLISQRNNFKEVVGTMPDDIVVEEAKRCFYCGDCNACLNCFKFCPDAAIALNGDNLKIDYDYCKGCGICVEECPRNAMGMEEESNV